MRRSARNSGVINLCGFIQACVNLGVTVKGFYLLLYSIKLSILSQLLFGIYHFNFLEDLIFTIQNQVLPGKLSEMRSYFVYSYDRFAFNFLNVPLIIEIIFQHHMKISVNCIFLSILHPGFKFSEISMLYWYN